VIKPIVIHVSPAASPAQPATTSTSIGGGILSLFNAIAMPLIVVVLVFALLNRQTPEPGPGPNPPDPIPTVNVVDQVESAQRKHAANMAAIMDRIADDVLSRKLTSWEAIQTYGRDATARGRANAFSSVDTLDTAQSELAGGEIKGREDIVARHFRSKAEGHRRAAK
jgi:hypothetical protein